jgi:hypothetical protein
VGERGREGLAGNNDGIGFKKPGYAVMSIKTERAQTDDAWELV